MNSFERIFALKISLIMSVRMLGLFMLFPVMSFYASEYDNSTPFLVGMAIGIYVLTQALLQIPFGYLSDRFGRKPILVIGLLIFFLGSILAANTSNLILVVIGRAFQGGGAISAVLMAFLADSVNEENRAKANALVGFQIGLAFMLSLLIKFVKDTLLLILRRPRQISHISLSLYFSNQKSNIFSKKFNGILYEIPLGG